MGPVKLRERGENISRAAPNYDTVPTIDLLTQLHLSLNQIVVTIPAFIVSTHARRTSHQGQHRPRRISIIEHSVYVVGQHRPLPQRMVGIPLHLGAVKRLAVSHERWEETLLGLEVYTTIGIGDKIPRIVHQEYP